MNDKKDDKVKKKDQATAQSGTPLTREYLLERTYAELQTLASNNNVNPSLPQDDLINALEGIIVYGDAN